MSSDSFHYYLLSPELRRAETFEAIDTINTGSIVLTRRQLAFVDLHEANHNRQEKYIVGCFTDLRFYLYVF